MKSICDVGNLTAIINNKQILHGDTNYRSIIDASRGLFEARFVVFAHCTSTVFILDVSRQWAESIYFLFATRNDFDC